MDNFTCIYKILKALEKAMDYSEFDIKQINHEKLNITKERWSRYIEMMTDMGLIKGIMIDKDIMGNTEIYDNGIRITLKGLEYLTENTFMKKAYQLAKGIKNITPFI